MKKEEILEKIFSVDKHITTARNSMGCDENWYNPYYAIKHTFNKETIENFEEDTLNALVELAQNLSDNFY